MVVESTIAAARLSSISYTAQATTGALVREVFIHRIHGQILRITREGLYVFHNTGDDSRVPFHQIGEEDDNNTPSLRREISDQRAVEIHRSLIKVGETVVGVAAFRAATNWGYSCLIVKQHQKVSPATPHSENIDGMAFQASLKPNEIG